MTDLINFLRQRLDEDAVEIAKHPDEHGWPPDWQIVATEESNYPGMPFLQIAKKRAEREVEAKRRILDLHQPTKDVFYGSPLCTSCDPQAWPCATVRLLALPYADHPDFPPGYTEMRETPRA